LVLTTNAAEFGVELEPFERTHMSTSVNVGHNVSMKIAFLDKNGNPMLTPVTPDSPPVWSNANPAAGTLVVAPDGLSAVESAIAVGSDVVSLSVVAGGQTFSATLNIDVSAAPQVLGSVQIVPTVT
jgi:hypothetical protein